MGNNFSKRILPDEKSELFQEFHDSSIRGLPKNAKKNLKTLYSLGDLKLKEKDGSYNCYKIKRSRSEQGCSKYWSFLPRLLSERRKFKRFYVFKIFALKNFKLSKHFRDTSKRSNKYLNF